MSNWNPNSTGTKGLEWFPTASGQIAITSKVGGVAQSIVQSVSQAAPSIKVGVGTIPQRGGLYAVEVFDNEVATIANVTTVSAVPNEDVSLASWVEDGGSATTIYTQIDEGSTVNINDYIKLSSQPAGGQVYVGRLNTGALTLTGKRILSVTLNVHCLVAGGAALAFGLNLSGVNYVGRTNVVNVIQSVVNATWTYNPSTGLPWRIADIAALDTTDEFYIDGGAFAGAYLAVYAVWLDVVYCDENRLAFGNLDDRNAALTANAWNTSTVLTPTSGAWTKDGAGRHLVVLRRLNDSGQITFPFLADPAAYSPVATGWTPTLHPAYGSVSSMVATTRVIPIEHVTTGPADSADGQPYYQPTQALVFGAQYAEGEISGFAAANYGWLNALVNRQGCGSNLVVTVRKRSDSSQVGGALTVTPAMLDAFPDIGGGWKRLQAQINPAAGLLTATQYYLRFAAASATGAGYDYWSVRAYDTLNVGNAATFGGTTDAATINGAENTRYDLAATIATIPATPANLAVAVSTQTLADDSLCGVATIPRHSLTWTATALGGVFARYEVERSEAGGPWVALARITSESVSSFLDYEAPMGVAATYRVRTVRADGATSDWATSGAVTKPATVCVLYAVSNFNAAYNLALDYDPDVSYAFLEGGERIILAIYGRDDSLVFQPLEQRGTRASYMVNLSLDGHGADGTGLRVFAALRSLAAAPLPYVTLLDMHGNRMYATLVLGAGTMAMPSGQHRVALDATTVIHDYVLTVVA